MILNAIGKKFLLFTVATAAVLLYGCGEGQMTNVEYGNRNQILYLGNGDEPEDLDPQIVTGTIEHHIILALFEGLVSKHPATLVPMPGVAESWTISTDNKTYTFKIRSNARWSNGDALTAQDFVYSWQRILSPRLGSEYAYMLYFIKNGKQFHNAEITDFSQVGVQALDQYTLKIELENPTPYFLQLLDHHSLYPVHKATIEKFGAMDEHGTPWTRAGNLVSNGAFMLEAWEVNKMVSVKKNPHYWDAGVVRLNQINFYPVNDLITEERMFRSGQLHATLNGYMAVEKIAVYREENPELIHIIPGYATYYYEFNTTRKPYDDVRVRRALAMAIDRQQIIDKVVKGGQTPAYTITPPDPNGYKPEAAIEFDLVKAKQLLAEAGYPDGKGFPKVELMYNTLENHQKIAVAIQEMWKNNLNIDVELMNLEWKVYLEARSNLEHQIARAGWLADYVDPSNFLELMTSYNGNNHTGWKNASYDQFLKEAAATPTQEQRFALFQQAEQILVDQMPIIPIYFYSDINLVQTSVQGWHENIMKYYYYKGMSLADQP
jgi:oligopeptide transport system substrate-binding protein